MKCDDCGRKINQRNKKFIFKDSVTKEVCRKCMNKSFVEYPMKALEINKT